MAFTVRRGVQRLGLWGEQDLALSKESTFRTERWVKDLTLRCLPDASHFEQQDAPTEVNAMLEAWLTGRPVPGSPVSMNFACGRPE